jgi:uncharacterized pyridoxamine 5'-phosphate oxidase family protein/NAD-dependent dihydropyrimidine dehydrogenase PreA subunit
MKTTYYLRFIVREIHTTVVATVDEQGLPVTCAVDMMDSDENSLYFLTAKGKSFYERLKKQGYIALTGIKGENTMTSVAISLRGKVRELDTQNAKVLFDKNPYMYEIYPTEESRSAIRVFQLYDGSGEWFDLSKKPIERKNFSFGGTEEIGEGYFVTEKCIGCKLCYSKCPQKCIDISVKPVVINQNHCLHCGNCFEICPMRAIVKRG